MAKVLSPPGLEATTQGAFQAVFLGLGPGMGSLAGGFLANKYGFGALFLQGAITVLGGWMVTRGLKAVVYMWARSRPIEKPGARKGYELVPSSISKQSVG